MAYLRAGGILDCMCLTPSPGTPFPLDCTSFSPFKKSLHVTCVYVELRQLARVSSLLYSCGSQGSNMSQGLVATTFLAELSCWPILLLLLFCSFVCFF